MGVHESYWPEPGEVLDPNRALNELRELYAAGGPPDFEHMATLFMTLDTYLIEGGVLPQDWKNKR